MKNIREFLNIATARDKTRATVCGAIRARRVIEFFYHGGYRTVEPFCLGLVMSGEADNESLLCYQIGGFSELREVVGWKLYRASEMTDIEISNERFTGDRPGYDPDAVEMATIYCCVTPLAEAVAKAPEILKVEPVPQPEKRREPVGSLLTHNELMRRFRFGHPIPIPEIYTLFFASPLHSPFPEPSESKNKPLAQIFGTLPVEMQTG